MAEIERQWTLGKVATQIGGALHGDPETPVSRPAPADSQDPRSICFAGSRKYVDIAENSNVGSVILSPDALPCAKPHIVVDDARAAFAKVLELWKRPLPLEPGIHPMAVVHPDAEIATTARIGPFAVIERGAKVGENACVYPFAYVGECCCVGAGAILFPHVVLYQDVEIGARTVVHSGAVLGADGFGFEWDGIRQTKVPQVGSVQIGDDVEIGPNTCVDRATSGTTRIASGAKIDNLVQVGHNASIGEHTVIAAQTGISGSTQIGERVTMGGACATSDHVRIADGARLGGRTGVLSDIEEAGEYWGMPARPLLEALRSSVLVYRLPEILNRLRELERRLEHDGPNAEVLPNS